MGIIPFFQESSVTRSGTWRGFKRHAFFDETSLWIDGEDPDEVSAEVWNDDEGVRGVNEGLVGMGRVLTFGVGTRGGEREGEGLEGFNSAGGENIPS